MAFWQIPNTITARHWPRVSRNPCPISRATAKAMNPAIKNRSADTVKGGACVTMIRAEVNALDQISAKASPMAIDLKSIPTPQFHLGKNIRPPQAQKTKRGVSRTIRSNLPKEKGHPKVTPNSVQRTHQA